MFIDFTSLNKACSKDCFHLPLIDRLDSFHLPLIDRSVDASADHRFMSFIDAFSRYNQISMVLEDQNKTTFVTDEGLFCFRVMPFGLKNVGATYQQLVNKIFKEQIGDCPRKCIVTVVLGSSHNPGSGLA
ncbi:RNA-directed DNA polymerase-like protein [Gossypium australe]|uniref:RNA-directed DNA polymerase-like protein n=1 Tax=Gossypium australe TaxID=47621 RepID=A0A5B6WD20_9ROSI|nr:RNA-directed DNA polymerase-like protein [Gossypium australe]